MDINILERNKPLILVVDDELVGRLYIEKALQSEGYEVITAENGQQALDLVREHSPSMIVMDVMMPVMDGYDACAAIREQEDQLQVPILMLTGLDDIESVEKSFDAGASDFIVKPVNLPIFKQRVRHGLKTRESDLELYKHQLRQAHAHKVAKMGYWDWDLETNKLYWSAEVYNLLSVSPDEFDTNQEAFKARIYDDDLEKVKHATQQSLKHGFPYSVEHRVARPDQKLQVVHQHAELIKNDQGKVIRMLGIVQDMTERYLAQEKIQHQVYYDSLTDLPNRTLFHDRLDHALDMPGRTDNSVAILTIDLDRFKNINDSLGHEVGDSFLKAVADNLKKATRTTDTLARLGGDEFALIIEGISSDECVSRIANKLLETLSQPHYINGQELISTGSIGIAVSSLDSCDKDMLIKQANLAMKHAKEIGGNQFCLYNEEMKSRAHQTLIMEKELRYALERGEFIVYYQPKVCVATGKIKGMEALIRWQHPEKGLVPPFSFIPVAEDTGLIVPIGKWVLEEASRQTKLWHEQGFNDLVVSVNVSVKQFHHQAFVDEVKHALKNSGLAARYLDLEITESCTMNNLDSVISFLTTFRKMGISISLDDFGTGFSSLSILDQLPLDTLKVDRAFIKDIIAGGENGDLARLIIAMAKSLQLSLVAEGVETQDHLDFLKSNGCDEYQGFFLSPPVPADQFGELLAANNRLANNLECLI